MSRCKICYSDGECLDYCGSSSAELIEEIESLKEELSELESRLDDSYEYIISIKEHLVGSTNRTWSSIYEDILRVLDIMEGSTNEK